MKITKSPLFLSQEKKLTFEEMNELKKTIITITKNPEIGTERKEIRENVRVYQYVDTVGKKSISYYVGEGKIVFLFVARLSLNL